MYFALVILGSMVMVISVLLCCVFLFRLCLNLKKITPFRKEYKSTYAVLVGFQEDTTNGYPISYLPTLKYFNEYKAEYVEKSLLNCPIQHRESAKTPKQFELIADVGEKIAIDYTKYDMRVTDTRFISPKTFSLSRYIVPLIVCAGIGFVGFIVFISRIVVSMEMR